MNKLSVSHPKLILNSYSDKSIEGETLVTDHIFSYIIKGKHDVWIGDKKFSFEEGDFRFFKRNQLTKSVKSTNNGGFRSVAVHIDQATLREMSSQYKIVADEFYDSRDPILIKPDENLKSFAELLLAYLQKPYLDERIALLKAQELILLLIQNESKIKNILFDFSDPGKIDLEGFMNSHYRYNISVGRFAFLTGRSLSAFKRDFKKVFDMSPGKWLVQKRLAEAKFRIEEKLEKPSEIYLDLGFEDLSHFSFAYKKIFGYAPRKKLNQ
ncbi:AraC family transcriptional regulator [Chryseobacterium sp.]|uniref:helix-turn-helix domain-containing protein n=1 Tax=Chryseobacterium sp. TaxID=1871047 RepID=UPI0028A1F272|nr:AraC family transcriptional regulator [Chryseobacterium sp.]